MNEMTRRRFLGTAGMAAAAPAIGTMAAQNKASISIEKNIVFGKGGNTDLRLDIYRPPAGTEKRMATIHMHGGGFTGGSKETLSERVLPYATAGYVAIPVQYRLTGEAKWPAQIEDVKAAIRWARANAKSLGIDPEKSGSLGIRLVDIWRSLRPAQVTARNSRAGTARPGRGRRWRRAVPTTPRPRFVHGPTAPPTT